MKLVVTAPVAEIFASWRQTTRFILLAAIAILAIFIVATLFIAGALTKPLLQLAQASQKLASGNFNAKLDYDGEDELGILTRSFRQMRDHLQMYISDLNSRAYSDALTGIKNKGAFDIYAGRLNNNIKLGAEQDGPEFAVVMFDCNWLKEINDAYGHERGDIYLRATSHAICETFTHSPVFRLGGDEFATLLQGSDYKHRDELLQAFDKKTEEVAATVSHPWEKVDVARGIAVFRPGEDAGVEQVLRRADEQMYENKRQLKLVETPPLPAY